MATKTIHITVDVETEAAKDGLTYAILGVSVDGKKIEGNEGAWETSYVIFDDTDNYFKIDLQGGTY